MTPLWKYNHAVFLVVIGALAWLVPGAGHFALDERKRGIIIFVVITLTFITGLYVGSVGVVDPVNAKPWFAAQLMNSPAVLLVGEHVADEYRLAKQMNDPKLAYIVYGRSGEVGQIYTSIAGLLNLLCVVNAIYSAHLRGVEGAST
jgi:hypothetical protein